MVDVAGDFLVCFAEFHNVVAPDGPESNIVALGARLEGSENEHNHRNKSLCFEGFRQSQSQIIFSGSRPLTPYYALQTIAVLHPSDRQPSTGHSECWVLPFWRIIRVFHELCGGTKGQGSEKVSSAQRCFRRFRS